MPLECYRGVKLQLLESPITANRDVLDLYNDLVLLTHNVSLSMLEARLFFHLLYLVIQLKSILSFTKNNSINGNEQKRTVHN